VRAVLHDAREIYREHSGAASNGAAARPLSRQRPDEPALTPSQRDDPDVLLDVSRLHVDELDLDIDEVKARVALGANILDLLRLDVGVDAELRGVDLEIKGVDAQALLKVRLENLTTIVDRVMSTIDRNPQILDRLTERLGAALDGVGSSAGAAVRDLGAIATPGNGNGTGAHAPAARRRKPGRARGPGKPG